MIQSITGKLRNTKISKHNGIFAIYEAIMNSIHAIGELDQNNVTQGEISIYIERDDSLFESLSHIKNISIIDNGVGFNKDNFDSFNKADSEKKISLGGKGLGRFTWLKVFSEVTISSVYYNQNNEKEKVSFKFSSIEPGIHNVITTSATIEDNIGTTIKLENLREKYLQYFPKKLNTISEFIVEHFLSFFLSPNFPNIYITDAINTIYAEETFNELYSNQIGNFSIDIKDTTFYISFIKKYKRHNKKHEVHFCADNRKVSSIELTYKNIAGLHGAFNDETNEFYAQFYVFSNFLDENTNQERTAFIFDDEESLFPFSFNMIKTTIIQKIKDEIEFYLKPIKDRNKKFVDNYINKNAPQYSMLKTYGDVLLGEIHDGLSDVEIDNKLFFLKRKVEIEVKEELQQTLYNSFNEPEDINEYNQNLSSLITKISDLNQSSLTDYVIHRKTILTLFEKFLEVDEKGKYYKENAVHKLIVPMQKDSNEIGYSHNLWLIDEKLSYHTYMASDKPINEILDDHESGSRPDIMFAFSNDKEHINSITIFELKRPMRNEYPEDDNPITQVQNYIEKLQAGKIKNSKGRPLQISKDTPFYVYILCDITPKIQQYAKQACLNDTPDQLGYFDYLKTYNAYIEIISYDKLIHDAKKRNKILFEKLGIE